MKREEEMRERERETRVNWSARRWDFLTCFRRRKFAHHLHITARVVKEIRDYRLELYACSSFSSFFFLLFLFLQTSRQGSLNRDVIFKMSFRKACFRFINDPTIHLRLRKGNKNTVFNNLRGRVTRKVCLTS